MRYFLRYGRKYLTEPLFSVKIKNIKSLMQKIYLKNLDKLIEKCAELPNTVFFSKAKILVFIVLNMRYEVIMKQRELRHHPYKLTQVAT